MANEKNLGYNNGEKETPASIKCNNAYQNSVASLTIVCVF